MIESLKAWCIFRGKSETIVVLDVLLIVFIISLQLRVVLRDTFHGSERQLARNMYLYKTSSPTGFSLLYLVFCWYIGFFCFVACFYLCSASAIHFSIVFTCISWIFVLKA